MSYSPDAASTPDANRRGGVSADLVVILCGICAALHVGKLPPALPVLRDALGVTLVQAGFLLSLMQFAGMTLGLAVGLAADGLGLRRSMLIGLLVLAGASAAGGWARGPSDLLWLRGVESFGLLLVALPAPSLIARLVPPERLSLRLGLWGCYIPVGTAIGLLLGPWAMQALGWQGWWWIIAMLSVMMALWLARAVPVDARRSAPAVGRQDWWQRLRLTLRTPGPWLVALSFACYSAQWLAVIGFLPSIYAQAGIGGPLAGALSALAALANIVGNIGSGRLLHGGIGASRLLGMGFAAMAVGSFLLFGSLFGEAPAARYLAVLLFSSLGGLIPGTLFSLAVQVAPSDRTVSTTVGWMQQWLSIGQFGGPPVVAWVASQTGGWQWSWVVTGIFSVLGLLLAALLARVHRRVRR